MWRKGELIIWRPLNISWLGLVWTSGTGLHWSPWSCTKGLREIHKSIVCFEGKSFASFALLVADTCLGCQCSWRPNLQRKYYLCPVLRHGEIWRGHLRVAAAFSIIHTILTWPLPSFIHISLWVWWEERRVSRSFAYKMWHTVLLMSIQVIWTKTRGGFDECQDCSLFVI